MFDTISHKEEEIVNNLLKKELKAKKRPPDNFYKDGSFILYNEDGIFYSCETMEKLNADLDNIVSKLKNFERIIEEFKLKAEKLV